MTNPIASLPSVDSVDSESVDASDASAPHDFEYFYNEIASGSASYVLSDLVKQIGVSQILSPVELDSLRSEICSRFKVRKSVISEYFQSLRGNGKIIQANIVKQVINAFGGLDGFSYFNKQFHHWNGGGRWVPTDKEEVRKRIMDFIPLAKQTAPVINSIESMLRDRVFLRREDLQPVRMNCLNGELEWNVDERKFLLLPHDRTAGYSFQIPRTYDPSAAPPMRFFQYLDEIFEPDIERSVKIPLLMELFGYTFFPTTEFDKFVFLYGPLAANGKTVVLNTLTGVLGPQNVSNVAPKQMEKSFHLASLHGKLANIVGDINAGENMHDGAVKNLTSSDGVGVEYKFRDPFTLVNTATLWFGSNLLPIVKDYTRGFWRRVLMIGFNRSFENDPLKDTKYKLKEYFADEYEQIFNWALHYYQSARQRDSFTQTEESERLCRQWRNDIDSVSRFIEVYFIPDIESVLYFSDIWNLFTYWAMQEEIQKKPGKKSFRYRLSGQNVQVFRLPGDDSFVVKGLRRK